MSEPAEQSIFWKVGKVVLKITGALCLLFVVGIISFIQWVAYPPYLFSDIMTVPDECELVTEYRNRGDGWNPGRSFDGYTCSLSEAEIEEYLSEYTEKHGGSFEKRDPDETGKDEHFVYFPTKDDAYVELTPK